MMDFKMGNGKNDRLEMSRNIKMLIQLEIGSNIDIDIEEAVSRNNHITSKVGFYKAIFNEVARKVNGVA